MRQIAEAAKFTPGLWLLNRIAKLWLDAADELKFALRPPDDYVPVHGKFFDLLEAGEADAACTLMADYLERHDAMLSKALGGLA
jgi:DNA-binding FadR family transcriptional regulator